MARPYNKYDWDLLKLEFMAGPYLSVKEFAAKYGIPPETARTHCLVKKENWECEKFEVGHSKSSREQIIQELSKKKAEDFAKFNESAKIANDLLLEKGMNILVDESLHTYVKRKNNGTETKHINAAALRIAKEIIIEAQKSQRIAFDVDNVEMDDKMPEPLTIENINIGNIY